MSVNIQTSDGLVKIAGTPKIDTSFSNISKNPVQNNVITQKFEQIDSQIRTQNSNLINLKVSDIAGGKNLFDMDDIVNWEIGTPYYFRIKIFHLNPNTTYTMSMDKYPVSTLYFDGGSSLDEPKTITTDSTGNVKIEVNINKIYDCKVQLELGDKVTDYEPYIPSVKMLADEVSSQNESLADYGLDNKCNSLEQGYATWWDANVEQSPDYIHTDFISVSNGDLITIKGGLNASHVIFYNASKEFISFVTDVNKVSVPSGVAFVRANFYGSGITPINVNIGIYVENQIDVIKNDLKPVMLGQFDSSSSGDLSESITNFTYINIIGIKQNGMEIVTEIAPISFLLNGYKYNIGNTGSTFACTDINASVSMNNLISVRVYGIRR